MWVKTKLYNRTFFVFSNIISFSEDMAIVSTAKTDIEIPIYNTTAKAEAELTEILERANSECPSSNKPSILFFDLTKYQTTETHATE
jgi:hypothetical protein